jgi:hypothetical protein
LTKHMKYLALVGLLVVAAILLAATVIESSRPEGSARADENIDLTLEETVETTTTTTTTLPDLTWINELGDYLDSLANPPAAVVQTQTQTYVAPPVVDVESTDGQGRWDQLAQCEAGGNWATNTGNGFGGGLQFMHQSSWSTWNAFGGREFAPNPWDASREEQIIVAERVLASSGWGAWPGCSRKFGWL